MKRHARFDLGQLLLAAAGATDTGVDVLVRYSDMTLLALIAERTRQRSDATAAAVEMLVGIAAGRPFPRRNTAAAWALASCVADARNKEIRIDPVHAATITRAARDGVGSERDLVRRLRPYVRSRRRALEAFERAVTMPAARAPTTWSCPECGRDVTVPPRRSSIFLVDPFPHDVVTDCARRNRGHGRGTPGTRYRELVEAAHRTASGVG